MVSKKGNRAKIMEGIRRRYSEDNLSTWIERKNQGPYLELLEEIVYCVEKLFPEDLVHNPHIPEIVSMFPVSYQKLYTSLVSSLTLLHHPYRIIERGFYVSDKEDNYLAFRLLQPLSIPSTLLRRKSLRLYDHIHSYFGNSVFTFNEVLATVEHSRPSLRRHFISLEHSGYIERVGGDRKKGYRYEAIK